MSGTQGEVAHVKRRADKLQVGQRPLEISQLEEQEKSRLRTGLVALPVAAGLVWEGQKS